MRRLVGLLARLFPRPFTIYAGRAEDVSLGLSELARALTNSENRKQRGGERAARGCGTGAGLASRPRRGRNGETNGDGSYSKDYGKTKGRGVNQRAGESVELDNLAPRVESCSEQAFGEPAGEGVLRRVNRSGRFRNANSHLIFGFQRPDSNCLRSPESKMHVSLSSAAVPDKGSRRVYGFSSLRLGLVDLGW